MFRNEGSVTNQQDYSPELLTQLSDFYKKRLESALEKTNFINQFKKHFPGIKEVRVLSIGSGPHPIEIAAMQSLLDQHGLTMEYHGIECDSGAIKKCREGYSGDNIHFHQLDATNVQSIRESLGHSKAHIVITRHPVLNPANNGLSKTFRDIFIRVVPKILEEHGCIFTSNYMPGEHDVAANILQAINSSDGFFDLEKCERDFKITENGYPLFPEQFFLGVADFKLSLVAELFNTLSLSRDHNLNVLIEHMQTKLVDIKDDENRIALFTHIIMTTLRYQENSDFAALMQAPLQKDSCDCPKDLSDAIEQLNLRYKCIDIPFDKEMGFKNTNVSGRQYLLMENLITLCDEIKKKPEYLNADSTTREKYLLNIVRLVSERPYGQDLNAHRKVDANASLYNMRWDR